MDILAFWGSKVRRESQRQGGQGEKGVANEQGEWCCLLSLRSLLQISFMVLLHGICEFLSFGFMRS